VGPYRLYSTAELLAMPPPEWLIRDILPMGELSVAYAPPESYKSFLGMDIALSVACGIPWQGKEMLTPGFVIYIAAEGVAGLGKRALAWFMEKGINPDTADVAWLTESLAVTADSDALLHLLSRIEDEVKRVPVLIVIDTLARCFDGEENETGDMAKFVAGCDVLRHKFGCAVLVIHHTRMDGSRERGNTALRGGSRMMMSLEKDSQSNSVTVTCTKMNDAEHFADMALELKVVDLGIDHAGNPVTSCVLNGTDLAGKKTAQEEWLVSTLQDKGPLKWSAWMAATGYDASLFPAVYQRIKGRVEKDPATDLWRVK
jgi:putative DNA primase/helicase